MKKEARDFPREVHVIWIEDDNDEKGGYFAVASTGSAEEALTETTTELVATYKLAEVKRGKLEPVFSTIES